MVYGEYNIPYPNKVFEEDTLKDQLWDVLKKLKIKTSNEKGSERVALWNEEVMMHLKSTQHATRNILKC